MPQSYFSRKTLIVVLISTLTLDMSGPPVAAGWWTELFKSGRRLLSKKAAGDVVEQTAKQGARRGTTQTASKTLVTSSFGRGARRFGDDVVKTGRKAGTAVSFADELAVATNRMSPQNSRRLFMLADELEATGHGPQVVGLLAKHGQADELMEFLWRHKGTLVGSAAVTMLCLHPDQVLGGTTDVAKHVTSVVGESVAEPVVEHVAAPIASALSIGLLLLTLAVGVCLLFAMGKSGVLNQWADRFKAQFARKPGSTPSGPARRE
ncbi:MAG: hypothetical protein MPJ50_15480 [Pirellulales bacterium]|nr:hypothetical protein [Pirellulales bacterium]